MLQRTIPHRPQPTDGHRLTAFHPSPGVWWLAACLVVAMTAMAFAQTDVVDVTEHSFNVERRDNFALARASRPDAPFGLLLADAMTIVYPHELPCLCTDEPDVLELARGEWESVQIVTLAYDEPLRGVAARVAAVRGPNGEPVADTVLQATVAPLGFLNIRESTYYELNANPNSPARYEGWIPDPIRTDIPQADVASGSMQPFWLELYAAPDAPPGRYTVTIAVRTDDPAAEEAVTVPVEVWPFTIEDKPYLRTAFTTNYAIFDRVHGLSDPAAKQRMYDRYTDFLYTFKLEPDSLYHGTPPDADNLRRRLDRWGLDIFNVTNLDPTLFNPKFPETWQSAVDTLLGRIDAVMTHYENAGVADRAYAYGFDESQREYHRAVRGTLRQLKERFPDLPVMTTLWDDNTLGERSNMLGLVDVWVPYLQAIDKTPQAIAQAAGDQVYWYIAIGTQPPYANWFNGQQPSQARLLMGAMSFKQKVDGFLYYYTNLWNYQSVMDDGLFSAWDPRTWNDANGDGSLFYPGADGPVASQRLQNFRDGMEDYNLLVELAMRTVAAERIDTDIRAELGELVARARNLLTADDVASALDDFTDDPAAYRAWRRAVAATIIAFDAVLPADWERVDWATAIGRPTADDPALADAVAERLAGYQRAWISRPTAFLPESGPVDLHVFVHPDVDVAHVTLTWNDDTLFETTERPDPSAPVATVYLPDGPNTLNLTVTDSDGRVWHDETTVTVVTTRILQPEPGEFVRETVTVNFDTVFEAADLTDITVTLTPIVVDVDATAAPMVVHRAATGGKPVSFDSLAVPDGAYILTLTARDETGRETTDTVNIVVDNWARTVVDAFEMPTETWFGLIDRKQTTLETDGWDYATDERAVFFGDAHRRVWDGDGTGVLQWESHDIQSIVVTLYARSADAAAVTVRASADGNLWHPVSMKMRTLRDHPSGWTMYELTGFIDFKATHVELGAGPDQRKDALQIGRVLLRARQFPVPKTVDEGLLFSFETADELSLWHQAGSGRAKLTDRRATDGVRSVHFEYPPAPGRYPAISIRWPAFSRTDWSDATHFTFDVYNDNDDATRVSVRLDDSTGTRYQTGVTAPAEVWTRFVVPIATAAEHIDVSDVRHINLFLSGPDEGGSLYFDNLRLWRDTPDPLP